MIDDMTAFCLDMHADYRCQHAGACCTAGWAIPAEPVVVQTVETHFRTAGRLFINSTSSPDDPPIVATTASGACVFFDQKHDRLCAIHRDLGHAYLPSACRHFPRVVLTDERGTFISLSHFCPTAAAMLFSDRPLRRVAAPSSLSLDEGVEGLNARGVLPPLLRPGMLTDVEGYDAWEQAGIDVLARGDLSADQALDVIEDATRRVEGWRPGTETLAACVRRAFDRARVPDVAMPSFEDARRRLTRAREAVPAGLTLPPDDPDAVSRWPSVVIHYQRDHRIIGRYLAARLFGNWIAYCGEGLRTVTESLRVHLAVLRMELARRAHNVTDTRSVLLEAIRTTDLLLVHYADSRALARLIDRTS
jgi:Fe-S-cluster containining protein